MEQIPATTGAADHRRVLEAAAQWQGAPLAIATVIETWRSAPCPAGTHLLVRGDGRFTGSVSGGCVEGDVLQTAADVIAGAPFAIRRYGLANDAVWEAGLPCGGDIVVLVQPVSAAGFAPALFGAITAAHAGGETATIATDLATGCSRPGEAGDFVNRYLPPRRLIVVGAVEIAAHLIALAQTASFAVTLVDPRARFLTTERFPGVVLDDRWPDEAIAALVPDPRTAIVTLSHDAKIDDPALAAAAASAAGYIAALGSQASHDARLARLRLSPADAARIEGPAGVAINAISAPEIALSIAGGMIRALNRGLR